MQGVSGVGSAEVKVAGSIAPGVRAELERVPPGRPGGI